MLPKWNPGHPRKLILRTIVLDDSKFYIGQSLLAIPSAFSEFWPFL
jgi:hypothetical protein